MIILLNSINGILNAVASENLPKILSIVQDLRRLTVIQALEEVRKIKPKRTLFTGMMHLMDHEKVSEELEKLMDTEGLDVKLSYDGLRVPISI
ncbi:hypothetical protein F2Q70_00009957 [Brassica cretica]|uniref:Uncharacterized protein n=1 Tax=Brassica cretica TaxID=69181 RepID=A0A8S9MDQ5_BRACR|nr:hypothetical protein F2Q70_00009957 [Brassica cretica]